MNASEKPVFLFHADANPIGGQITHPVQHMLPPQGSSSLAQAGGHAAGQIGPHHVDGIISFQDARSEIYGSKRGSDGPWTSTISASIEKLNVLDILRADAIVAKLKITHPHAGIHPTVSFAGTHFHNLTIAGKAIDPVLDLQAYARTEEQTKEHKGHWESDPRHLGAAVEHNRRVLATEGVPSWIRKRYDWMTDPDKRSERGHVVCSLVKHIRGAEPNPTYGHILHVPEIGNIFLGEVYVNHGMFRVTMLRIEMGCIADGDISAVSAGGNGGTMPG